MKTYIIGLTFLMAYLLYSPMFSSIGLSQSSSGSKEDGIIRTAENPPPKVIYPTDKQISVYLVHDHNNSVALSNSSINPHDLQAAAQGNHTFVSWISIINKTNNVFLSVSHDHGSSFSMPVQLSKPNSGNASNLKMALSNQPNSQNITVGLIWREALGSSSNVVASTSMNSGDSFITFKLNGNGTYATNPQIIGNSDIQFVWSQANGDNNSTSFPWRIMSHCCSW
jgi:hypothetical protein